MNHEKNNFQLSLELMVNDISQGHSGAMHCLTSLYEDPCVPMRMKRDILYFAAANNIKGLSLYRLWCDICNENLIFMHYIISNVPKETLVFACNEEVEECIKMLKPWIHGFKLANVKK